MPEWLFVFLLSTQNKALWQSWHLRTDWKLHINSNRYVYWRHNLGEKAETTRGFINRICYWQLIKTSRRKRQKRRHDMETDTYMLFSLFCSFPYFLSLSFLITLNFQSPFHLPSWLNPDFSLSFFCFFSFLIWLSSFVFLCLSPIHLQLYSLLTSTFCASFLVLTGFWMFLSSTSFLNFLCFCALCSLS